MGEIDLHHIHPIYRLATDFCKLMDLPFQFREDSGSFETLIAISETGKYRTYHEKNDRIYIPFVPDIIDYKNKIIIEFEEETGNRRTGAKMARKGHGHEGDMPTKRDERRNKYYKLAGFTVLSIWESQFKSGLWKTILAKFLISCHEKPTFSVLAMIPDIE